MSVVIFVLDVEEFAPLVKSAKAMDGVTVTGPNEGYFRISAENHLEFNRKELGFKPAVWYGALTGGLVGRITEFSRDVLKIEGE
jgi:hypothetical protein